MDIEWSNMKDTFAKYAKNQLQNITGGVVVKKTLTSEDQSQELPKNVSN